MTTATYNDSNPFAVKFTGTGRKVSYILTHQPKSFDWRLRGGKPHPWKKVPDSIFTISCSLLEQIIKLSQ